MRPLPRSSLTPLLQPLLLLLVALTLVAVVGVLYELRLTRQALLLQPLQRNSEPSGPLPTLPAQADTRHAREPAPQSQDDVPPAVSVVNARRPNKAARPQSQPQPRPPPPPQSKFIEPVRDASWRLLPDQQVPHVSPLPNEGLLSDMLQSLTRTGRGVLFNAIHKDPEAGRASKTIAEAARSAQRMWRALYGDTAPGDKSLPAHTLGFALFTERQPWRFMNDVIQCRSLWPECTEFAATKKYLTHVLFYDDLPVPKVVERRERFQTWPELWLKRIVATLHTPFAETLVVDSDVFACGDFHHLFDEYLQEYDVALTAAPAPFGGSRNYNGAFRAGFPQRYSNFTERNLGIQLLKTAKPQVMRLIALFRDVYVRQANDVDRVSIGNDQAAFREALFTLQDSGSLRSTVIPSTVACRHEGGCADGCLLVHRHHQPEMSRAEYEAWKRQQNALNKARREAAAGGAGEGGEGGEGEEGGGR